MTRELIVSLVWHPALLTAAGLTVLLGLVAVIRPPCFHALAWHGSTWVDSNRWVALLDRRIDVDAYVLPHARLFGCLLLAAMLRLALAVLSSTTG